VPRESGAGPGTQQLRRGTLVGRRQAAVPTAADGRAARLHCRSRGHTRTRPPGVPGRAGGSCVGEPPNRTRHQCASPASFVERVETERIAYRTWTTCSQLELSVLGYVARFINEPPRTPRRPFEQSMTIWREFYSTRNATHSRLGWVGELGRLHSVVWSRRATRGQVARKPEVCFVCVTDKKCMGEAVGCSDARPAAHAERAWDSQIRSARSPRDRHVQRVRYCWTGGASPSAGDFIELCPRVRPLHRQK
jgi:hypothetical protein